MLACSLVVSTVHAATFERLNDCSAMATVVNQMLGRSTTSGNICVKPTDPLGAAIVSRLSQDNARYACVPAQPLPRALNGFTCVDFHWNDSAHEMLCVRGAQFDFENFKASFKQVYASEVNAYLTAASKCAVSNGEALTAVAAAAPMALYNIARFEKGFALRVRGVGSAPIGEILHGFAALDPLISIPPYTQVEFINFYIGAASSIPEKKDLAILGPWEVDQAHPPLIGGVGRGEIQMDAGLMYVDSTEYNIAAPSSDDVPAQHKEQLLNRWDNAVRETLRAHKFSDLSEGDLELVWHMNYQQARARMIASVPFGWRTEDPDKALYRLSVFSFPNIHSNQECFFFAMQATMRPRVNVAEDFGSVFTLINGGGACPQGPRSAKSIVTSLVHDIKTDLFRSLASVK